MEEGSKKERKKERKKQNGGARVLREDHREEKHGKEGRVEQVELMNNGYCTLPVVHGHDEQLIQWIMDG